MIDIDRKLYADYEVVAEFEGPLDPAQVEHALAALTYAESALAVDLVELDSNPTFKLLAGTPLRATTATELGHSISDAPQLWLDWSSLRDRLAEMRARRADAVAADELQQAHDHLAALAPRVGRLKANLERVDAQWRTVLPHVDRSRSLLGDLDDDAEAASLAEPAIDAVRSQIERIEDKLAHDPLGVTSHDLHALDAATDLALERVRRLTQGRAALDADHKRAEGLRDTLRELARQAAEAATASRAKIRHPIGLVEPPHVEGESLAQLERAALDTSQSWVHRRRALDRYLGEADRLQAELSAAAVANRRPLDTRNELRGLLSAYRAKAAVDFSENAEVAALLRAAHDELHTAPCDLDRARSLLDQTANRLRSTKGSQP